MITVEGTQQQPTRPRFLVTLEPADSQSAVGAERRLAMWLKSALRRYGFRCIGIAPISSQEQSR